MDKTTKTDIDTLISAWQSYLQTVDDWQKLIVDIDPKLGGCGRIYELDNPIDRTNESFVIADMRDMDFSEPHKHINGEIEVYFVIAGSGTMSIGNQIKALEPGIVVVTPPDTAHCTYSPNKDIVLAVVNTPPFDANNVVVLNEADATALRNLIGIT
jgi:mannose-6-phosphate isomerase-like protein (cupin superfamily)